MGEMRNSNRFWLENLKRRDRSEEPERRWEDDIKMDLKEIRLAAVDWIYFALDTVQWRSSWNTILNLRVP
jgi:hypothetical protein